jgi:hypothetical protein
MAILPNSCHQAVSISGWGGAPTQLRTSSSKTRALTPPRATKPPSLTLVVHEEGGCEVVGQGLVVVGLHAGQAGPGVGDVLLHGGLAHGRVELPVHLSHLKHEDIGRKGAQPGCWKRALSLPRQPPPCGATPRDSSSPRAERTEDQAASTMPSCRCSQRSEPETPVLAEKTQASSLGRGGHAAQVGGKLPPVPPAGPRAPHPPWQSRRPGSLTLAASCATFTSMKNSLRIPGRVTFSNTLSCAWASIILVSTLSMAGLMS